MDIDTCDVCLMGFTSSLEGIRGGITEAKTKDTRKEMLKLIIVKTKLTGWGIGYRGARISIRKRRGKYES